MLSKLSNLNSNLALTPGYLNPALNNSAQILNIFFSKDNVVNNSNLSSYQIFRQR